MIDTPTVAVQITSDFICPWCFVAERRLAQTAQQMGLEIAVTYRPYELNPGMPKKGLDRREYRSRKFGSWAESTRRDRQTIESAQGDPLTFNYHAMEKTPNSRLAHRAVLYAQQHHSHLEAHLADQIFEAYFTRGLDIGQSSVLAAVAQEVGLEGPRLLHYLGTEEDVDTIERLQEQAMHIGLRGVPSLEIGTTTLYGAVDATTLREALHQALEMKGANHEQ